MSKALNEKPNAEQLPKVGTVGAIVNGHYSPPPADKDGKTWVRTCALVHAEASALRGLHSLLNLLLGDFKGPRFLILVLDYPIHFASNQDRKSRHVQPQH